MRGIAPIADEHRAGVRRAARSSACLAAALVPWPAAVVRAPPDGLTLLMVGTPNVVSAALYDKLNFDFIRDIAPVASIAHSPHFMVVNPSFPAKTVSQFIAYHEMKKLATR
jgi:tripartite-type tricarboxylate transporter receptor subunit TctC